MKMTKLFNGTEPITQNHILVLRVIIGILFINHGSGFFDAKAMAGFAGYLEKDLNFPLPFFMAYLRTGAELFGGIMLVLGLFSRLGAFLIFITMLVAGFIADKGDFFGDAEMAFAYAAVMLTIFLAGPSKFSLDYYFFGKSSDAKKN
jgi:putative oxidoreductase